MFYQVYLVNDGNVTRGVSKGTLTKKVDDQVYYNPSTGVIMRYQHQKQLDSFHLSCIPGDSFVVRFFKDRKEFKPEDILKLGVIEEKDGRTDISKAPKSRRKTGRNIDSSSKT